MCPARMVAEDPWVGAVLHYFNAKESSPIEGWPSAYAAWIVQGVSAIEHAIADRDRQLLEAQTRRGR